MAYKIGDPVSNFFIVLHLKQIAAGNVCVGTLHRNDTGDMGFKGVLPEGVSQGSFVYAEGSVKSYNGRPQFNGVIEALAPGTHEEKSLIVPHAANDPRTMFHSMMARFHASGHDPVAQLAEAIGNSVLDSGASVMERFVTFPAAKSNHHAYIGGLCQHTYDMFVAADRIADLYALDDILLLAGVFLHDIGKLFEYELAESGLVKNYTVNGNLQGHTFIGQHIVMDMARNMNMDLDNRVIALINMIGAHHGSREYGATCDPATPEAMVLHMLDDMDAKLDMYGKALDGLPAGTVTDVIPNLGTRLYKTDYDPLLLIDGEFSDENL